MNGNFSNLIHQNFHNKNQKSLGSTKFLTTFNLYNSNTYLLMTMLRFSSHYRIEWLNIVASVRKVVGVGVILSVSLNLCDQAADRVTSVFHQSLLISADVAAGAPFFLIHPPQSASPRPSKSLSSPFFPWGPGDLFRRRHLVPPILQVCHGRR